MDIEVLLDAIGLSFGAAVFIVLMAAAVIFVFIKKKNSSDYDQRDIPRRVEKPEETEGSTDRYHDGESGQ